MEELYIVDHDATICKVSQFTIYDSYTTHDRDSLSQLEYMIYYCIDTLFYNINLVPVLSLAFNVTLIIIMDTIELLMKAM